MGNYINVVVLEMRGNERNGCNKLTLAQKFTLLNLYRVLKTINNLMSLCMFQETRLLK